MRAYLQTTTAAMALLAATSSTHAQSFWTGQFSSDWFLTGNWIGTVPTGATNANINTVVPNPTVVASAGGTADTLSVGLNGTGSLTIQNGGTVTDIFGVIGVLQGSQGTVIVTGAGSTWTNISGGIIVGGMGTGALTVENGGTVNSSGASVGLAVGSTGAVTVTGPGSSWNNTALAAGFNIG